MSVPAEPDTDSETDSRLDGWLSFGEPDPAYTEYRFSRWFRWHLVVALAIFFGTAFGGYAVFGAIPVEGLTEVIPGESGPLGDIEFTFPAIMFNNLRALFLMGMGAVTAGALSVFGLVVNGLLVGAVVGLVVQQTSWAVILAALLPHGIIELTAFFMAAAIGLRVPHRLARYFLAYDETPLTRTELVELAVLSVVMVVMIVVAAWIEVNVTPEVIEMVGGPNALDGSPAN
jgi:stage II sporulation protein M